MEQVQRIKSMEKILDDTKAILLELDNALEKLKNNKQEYKKLIDYYGSDEWYQDMDDFDNNRITKDIKCCVLSEDGVYNLIGENQDIIIKMLEVATDKLKNNL